MSARRIRVRRGPAEGGGATRLAAVVAAVVFAAPAFPPQAASAQVRVRDLVVSLGGSVERFTGNLAAVSVVRVDSADRVISAVAETAVRADISLLNGGDRSLDLTLDGGVRQAAALGFVARDYAPREWAGASTLFFRESLGSWATLGLDGSVRARAIRDRPPMPMFLQPGYVTVSGSATLYSRPLGGVVLDGRVATERADYLAPAAFPQLDLLDRRGRGVEAGARLGSAPSNLRLYGGIWWTEYRHQNSFNPADPFRRDRTLRAGAEWSYFGTAIIQFGVDGALNRSNGDRPEYDAFAVRAAVTVPAPGDATLNAFALLTGKSYLHESAFARLVPGEEADNASVAYLQLVRPLAPDLDGAVGLAWTRAETNIGDQYYQRFGFSVEFNYRPLWR